MNNSSSGGGSDGFGELDGGRVQLMRAIVSVYGAIIIFFGCIGNMLSLRIFWNSDVFKESTHLLLIVLQIADSSVLVVAVGRYWVQQVFGVDIRDLSYALCVAHVPLTYLCVDSAIWVLVLIVVDRFLAVTYPIRARHLMTKRNVLKVLLLMLGLLFAKDVPLVRSHSWNITAGPDQPRCMYNADFFKYYVILDSLLNFALPDSLLLIFNVAIFCCLRRHARSMSRQTQQQTAVAAAANNNRKRSQGSRSRQMAVAKVALASGTVHLVTSMPSAIYLVSHSFIKYSGSNFLINNALMMLSYTNSAVNFLIYLPIDRKFRTSFNRMVTPECSHANANANVASTTTSDRHRGKKSAADSATMAEAASTAGPAAVAAAGESGETEGSERERGQQMPLLLLHSSTGLPEDDGTAAAAPQPRC